MIKLDDCVNNGLYLIEGRNFDLGVFNGEDGFYGKRFKIFEYIIFEEVHYEVGGGTAIPLKLLDIVPSNIIINEIVFLEYLAEKEREFCETN